MDASCEPPVLAIVGPTASGKTALALVVARRLIASGRPAEIVNADSMLVYRGMDIGTAKPSAAERAEIPHHLIDIADLGWTASVAQFQRLARDAIADIRSRGAVPLVVGGSALYIHAILDELSFPPTDPAVRARWQAELDRIGPQALHAVLAERAPEAAAGILPGNGRRIVRALEVVELTGSFTSVLPQPRYALEGVHQFGISITREELDERIQARVEQMWQAGFVEEVRELELRGLRQTPTASRALGYSWVLDYLSGSFTQERAREATVFATRRFARKQLSWFRRDARIEWVDATDPATVDAIARVCHQGPAPYARG
ncbi:MAG: tRNA (adenosine(37)-N6)-dimethylallyltransferase MiaA [Propionibacteriaceae bacterium]|nr:tRNA (adenosine(37)-N6)-dimethylallyltransferase MiaA [Propionibacteriaceae bacterium]